LAGGSLNRTADNLFISGSHMSTVSHKSNLYKHLIGCLLASSQILGTTSLAIAWAQFCVITKVPRVAVFLFLVLFILNFNFCCVFITDNERNSPIFCLFDSGVFSCHHLRVVQKSTPSGNYKFLTSFSAFGPLIYLFPFILSYH